MGNGQVLHPIFTLMIILLCCFHTQCQSQLNLSSSTAKAPYVHVGDHFLCHPDQGRALLQFKSHFVSNQSGFVPLPPPNVRIGTWNESTDCCFSWEGVTCNAVTGQVIGLDLSRTLLTPQLHDSKAATNSSGIFSSLFDSIPYLQILNIANIYFEYQFNLVFASLPPSLTHFKLRNTQISGYVPFEFSHLSKLVSLVISDNFSLRFESATVLKSLAQNLTHLRVLDLERTSLLALPDCASSLVNLSSSLTSLHLSNSGLQGTFPKNFLLLPNLLELYLSDNTKLSGSLPKLSNSTSLRVLQLSGTDLSGELPVDLIGNLKSLQKLDLYGCNFSGSIPVSIGNLTQITKLDLSHHHFSGAIPSSLGYLTQLRKLDLSENHLSGAIPSSLGYLTQLPELDLSENHLSGAIPSFLGYLTQLHYLDLGGNTLTGQIPNAILNLTQLHVIYLSNNQLEGSIPTCRGQPYPNLSSLDFSSNSLNGPIPSWLSSLPLVSEILLHHNHLSGPLSEFISPSLRFLDISNNQLNGAIPEPISKSVDFQSLDLSQNFLTSSAGELPEVGSLDLHSNLLEGSLPIPSPRTLYFSVSNNSFTGEVPSLICNASSLRLLDLSFNSLSGMIPQCLGNVTTSLVLLDLCMNNFGGTIPDTFANSSKLTFLNLNGNQLIGGLPRSLANCSNLEALDVDNNSVMDVFPGWMQTLQQLQVLVLRSNKFYGCVDIDLHMNSSFPMLRILDLSNNNFSGALPTRLIKSLKGMIKVSEDQGQPQYMGGPGYEISVRITMKGVDMKLEKILTIFTTIDMSNNKFDGNIPLEIGSLHALKGLNLSHNYLSGPIPPSLGELGNLEWLDLSSNELVGRIPIQLTDLNFLGLLNLAHNRLSGPIPHGTQFTTFKDEYFDGNSGLCGFPLPKCGSDDSNRPTQTASSDESDSAFSWKSSYVGYCCGTIIGMAMGYLVFSTGSPWWFVKMVDGGRQTKARRLPRNTKARGRGTRN